MQQAYVTSRGLQYDRRWMLINANNQFLSQRSHAKLSLFQLSIAPRGVVVLHKLRQESCIIPYIPETDKKLNVHIWDDTCTATVVSEGLNQWFTRILQIDCRLVYMDNDDVRPVDPRYAGPEHITSFADAYPMLLVGQSSLNDLNERLQKAVTMDRFRPNIVMSDIAAYEEDRMVDFTISGINFYGVKPCARCVMVTIDQQTAVSSAEPLKTLAVYRKANNKIYFGQNLIHHREGVVKVGDEIKINRLGKELLFE